MSARRLWLLTMTALFAGFFAIGVPESDALPEQASRDAEILAACMNGRLIALNDGQVLTCHIGRTRR